MATHRAESVRKLQRGLYRAAKSNGARKFYSLYDKVCRPDVLWQAWEEVKANRGAPGVDGLSIEAVVASGEMAFVAELGRQLKERTYRPMPVRRVLIPKPKGGQRALGIPSLADRVVQTAARVVLEPIFEADFRDCSYGYRPRRGARECSVAIRESLYQRVHSVIEVDVEAYFDTVPQDKLMVLLRERIADGNVLRLIWSWLRVGYLDERGAHRRTPQGVPQGSPISPLLSNVYLNLLDRVWERRGYPRKLRAKLYRYCDDMAILCRGNPKAAYQALEAILRRMDLTLHPEKTRITRVDEGFDFLSFHFVRRRSPTTGKRSFYIFPSKDSQKRVRENIRSFTHRRAPVEPEAFIGRINEAVRGWVNYFQHTNASEAFRRLQRFINLRVRRYLSQRHRERGSGWRRYPNRQLYAMGVIYIGSGRVRYATNAAR
jgi:group II intron reverse transcriptase/maturase